MNINIFVRAKSKEYAMFVSREMRSSRSRQPTCCYQNKKIFNRYKTLEKWLENKQKKRPSFMIHLGIVKSTLTFKRSQQTNSK